MAARRVVRSAPKVDPVRLLEEYLKADELAKVASKRAVEYKEQLRALVVEKGEPDDKGSLWLELGDRSIKNERRVSATFDRDAAEEWCADQGLSHEVTETIVQFSEDLFWKLVWERRIPKKVADRFVGENVTWAFKVQGGAA